MSEITLEHKIFQEISTVIDPEVGFNLVEMGLIYSVDLNKSGEAVITMTLSTPACPMSGLLTQWVEDATTRVEGVKSAEINLVFEPRWNPSMADEHVKIKLGG